MEREDLERWLGEGRSFEAIAREVGRHPSTVASWARKYGLASPHAQKHAAKGGLREDELRELVALDLTVAEIAETVGRSPTTVRHWLAFYGLRTTDAARGRRAIEGEGSDLLAECPTHGTVRHVRRGARLRCARCNSEAVSRRRREVKRILVEEAGGACAICGYDRWIGALQFHHVDPGQKRFNLGLKGLARAIDDVREEARKCVLLCANCHAEVEGGVASIPPSALLHIRG